MKIPRFEIIPILIGLLACQAHACQSSRKKGWYVKVYKADYEEQLKELDEAKTKEKEPTLKLQEEKNQNSISAIRKNRSCQLFQGRNMHIFQQKRRIRPMKQEGKISPY